jgi:multidrug efflux pump subunit AcrA (membrane-fusion protein)
MSWTRTEHAQETGTSRNGHDDEGPPVVFRRRRPGALAVVALGLVLGAGGWAYWSYRTARPAMDMSMRVSSGGNPFPVTLAPVELAGIQGNVTYTGSVAPFNEEEVYPRVMGRIIEMPVYPGDAVRPGQVLARLDDVELASRAREAEAMAVTAEANRRQMEADLVAARHGVAQMERELAMVDAEATYAAGVRQRAERLVASGAISRQDYENDRAMALSAEARREAARAKLEQARAMEAAARMKREAADSMVAQNAAAARTARIVRDYVTITAPGSGYVVKRLVAPGVLVQPGMAILKIAQIDRVRLQANVGEKDVGALRVGSPVSVTTLAGRVEARVTSVFPFVDPGSRTAVVEAVVDNRDRALLPGQYVTMRFVTGERANALTVPRAAVGRMGGIARVWVARDGQAQPREVQVGLEGAERVELTSGMKAGEQVVVRGAEGLYAGARISAAAVDATGPAPAAVPSRAPIATERRGHGGH